MSESVVPADPTSAAELVRTGLEAIGRHAWHEAFVALGEADRAAPLSGRDLEAYAEAAFFAGDPDLRFELGERAFKAYTSDADETRAAFIALRLAREYFQEGKTSISSAWARRAERLLDARDEGYAHGYLALLRSETARAKGDIDAALAYAEEAVRIGNAAADGDLQAWAGVGLGSLKIATGETSDGLAIMEELAIAAVNGELSPFTTGVTTCSLIAACRDLTDYQRASEWIEATEKWCTRQSVPGFPGVCRIHRAEVTAIGGAWDRAEDELRRATDELAAYRAAPVADGFYAMGDIRRLKGDLAGAEKALRQAHEMGRSPQPALALVRLAEGKVKAAATAIEAAVANETWDRWARARLLPAQVEIAIAAGDVRRARAAVDELDRTVESYPSPAMAAGRDQALGRVLLAEGDPEGAARALRRALKLWREVGAPYEVARTRTVLGEAARALGDDDDADLELQSALAEFARLGATLDVAAVERAISEAAERRDRPVQLRRTFMFTDIEGSTNLAELLGNESWERLLAWHDEALRTLVVRSGGEVVNSTGDGFFVAFESPRQGLDCAIAIQQALAEHRRTSGFAPSVRIGLHTAEANRRGTDYSGMGVHLAARVAALARGGEIVATAETLADVGPVASSDPREAAVKGVSAPVSVATVSWA